MFSSFSHMLFNSNNLLRALHPAYYCNSRFVSHAVDILEDRYKELLNDIVQEEGSGPIPSTSTNHDVLIIHPKVRWGANSASILKDPQRQLAEATALVNSLPGFRVVETAVVGVEYSTKRKSLVGSGRLEALMKLKENTRVSALMVNMDMLAPMQQKELFNIFRVPIYDRYNIVLSIFKHYATSQEAKLQIQLAEIPYLRHRMNYLMRYPSKASILHVEHENDKAGIDRMELLRLREQALRKKLKEVMTEIEVKSEKQSGETPMVSIVGYTNSGKTSLVKRLTGDEMLNPKNRLFATLETTRHLARLPSGRKTTFTDTIGFLSDLPIHLLSAFDATLAHVKKSDVIIHLRDISNPDWKAQDEDVMKTLKRIGLDEKKMEQIIVVDNKIDQVDDVEFCGESIKISCKTGEGMEQLIEQIDKCVMTATGCSLRRFKLNPSSPAIQYLYREGLVSADPLPSGSSLVFDVYMNAIDLARFQKHFPMKKKETTQ